MFIAGLGANFEHDLKKIITLSTLSNCFVVFANFKSFWAIFIDFQSHFIDNCY